MATIEYWIQLENRQWDTSPNNIDRMTGQDIKTITKKDPVDVQLKAPGGALSTKMRTMFNPLRDSGGKVIDALILRRYKPPTQTDESDAWTIPDDRKVNPWDLNEPDPTDNGTMGTIPGPVIECNVGDDVEVHFRNRDMRNLREEITIHLPFGFDITIPAVPLPIEKRCHSLHPHGFVFQNTSDGAYPLSPADTNQPVAGPPGPDETAAWSQVPVRDLNQNGKIVNFQGDHKQGDRVPPGGSYIYHWNTLGWPTTAGVWLYHDHSICDMDNVNLGAIGIIVIHNPQEAGDVIVDADNLPGGSPVGSPVQCRPFPFPFPVGVLPHDLERLGLIKDLPSAHGMMNMPESADETDKEEHPARRKGKKATEVEEVGEQDLIPELTVRRGDLLFELSKDRTQIVRICFPIFRNPPTKGLYLQLFHTLTGTSGMMINGRTYMGNTPTIVAGPNTKMRFGVVGMGDDFHTFHIHGHRWVVPGPAGFKNENGNIIPDPAVLQFGAPMNSPVSQFEDTKIFGPANSFVFTIDEGNGFMRASPAVGEWHMHCHVLGHMHMGMMGSLLIINGGEPAPFLSPLQIGVPCEMAEMGGDGMPPDGGPKTVTVHIKNNFFDPDPVNINVGDTVQWVWDNNNHSTTSNTGIWDSGVRNTGATFTQPFPSAGTFPYFCSQHGSPTSGMRGTVNVSS